MNQQTALDFIAQFEVVGDNNDSRDPTDEEKFVLREFVLQLFDDEPSQSQARTDDEAVRAEFERYFIDDAENQEHALANNEDGYIFSDTNEHWSTFRAACEWRDARTASGQPGEPTKRCSHCGTHEVSLELTCHNSSCHAYARSITVYEGWKLTDSAQPASTAQPEAAKLTDSSLPKLIERIRAKLPQPHVIDAFMMDVGELCVIAEMQATPLPAHAANLMPISYRAASDCPYVGVTDEVRMAWADGWNQCAQLTKGGRDGN